LQLFEKEGINLGLESMDRLRDYLVSEYLIGFLEKSVLSFTDSIQTLTAINEARSRMPYRILRKPKYNK
jgi:hypothetical protein